MASIIRGLCKKGLINPPSYATQPNYEVIVGSESYGVSSGGSDVDICSMCIPALGVIFPHTVGHIPGYGTPPPNFKVFQKHHVIDLSNSKEYDLSIYNIVHYFDLTMNGNPNMIDSLFVPDRCVLHCDRVGHIMRSNRDLFLSKKMWHTFKGYAFSQIKKCRDKKPQGKRKEMVDKYGVDVKYLYHVVRLLDEIEQVLETGTLNIERSRDMLKTIRAGGWSLEQVETHFRMKEPILEELYKDSTLPHTPREMEIKVVLLSCLEEYHGSMDKFVSVQKDTAESVLNDIAALLKSTGYFGV